MKRQVLDYEHFIEKAAEKPTDNLRHYHQEMMQNFQHERLIHLIVTLFFCGLALITLGLSCWFFCIANWNWTVIPFILVDLLLIGLSIAYVAHYYFLENHIQKLYKYTKKLAKLD